MPPTVGDEVGCGVLDVAGTPLSGLMADPPAPRRPASCAAVLASWPPELISALPVAAGLSAGTGPGELAPGVGWPDGVGEDVVLEDGVEVGVPDGVPLGDGLPDVDGEMVGDGLPE